MTPRDQHQNKRMWALMNKLKLPKDARESIVEAITSGRTKSTRDLNKDEARKFINHLQGLVNRITVDPSDRMRKTIIAIAHNMGWQILDCSLQQKPNMDRINNWCCTHGKFKKALNAHTYDELVELVTQFKQVERSRYGR
jgi:hypothetical protein